MMEQQQINGGNPDEAIGYIDPAVSQKVKTYLLAAQRIILNEKTAGILKQMLAGGNDASMAVAAFLGKTINALETKLGPLDDAEHDQVAVHVAGWIVSSLQKMGMPGLEDEGARQDLLGRILQALDGLTQEQGQEAPPQEGPPQEAAQPEAPMSQFGGA